MLVYKYIRDSYALDNFELLLVLRSLCMHIFYLQCLRSQGDVIVMANSKLKAQLDHMGRLTVLQTVCSGDSKDLCYSR